MAVVRVTQAYRFALKPTPAQERALRSHAGAARFAWNWGLAKCKDRYEAEDKWYSAVDLPEAGPQAGEWDRAHPVRLGDTHGAAVVRVVHRRGRSRDA